MKTLLFAVSIILCSISVQAQKHSLSEESLSYYETGGPYPLLHFPRHHSFISNATGNDTSVVLIGLAERFTSPYVTTYLDSLKLLYSLPKYSEVPGNSFNVIVSGSKPNASGTGYFADFSHIFYSQSYTPHTSDTNHGRTLRVTIPHLFVDTAFFITLAITDTNASDIEFGIAIDSVTSLSDLPRNENRDRAREIGIDYQTYVAGVVFHEYGDVLHWYSNALFKAFVSDGLSAVRSVTPDIFSLSTANPNLAGSSVAINYKRSESGPVTITVIDDRGRIVLSHTEGTQGAGQNQVQLSTAALPSGSYTYRLSTGQESLCGRFQVLH
jgi:hypothetical protein